MPAGKVAGRSARDLALTFSGLVNRDSLKGDLSLVGPRPEQQEFVARFNESIPFYAYRHLVRPGITGWAQFNYGYGDDEADTIEKLTFDLYYVKHMSPWLDVRIIGHSIWTILSGLKVFSVSMYTAMAVGSCF